MHLHEGVTFNHLWAAARRQWLGRAIGEQTVEKWSGSCKRPTQWLEHL